MTPADLSTYIFSGAPFGFPAPFTDWLGEVPAFGIFADTYRDKIRKKVHLVRDDETRADLQAELAIACWLCRDRRVAIEYEAYTAGKIRGPDFTATFRTQTRFNIEVTRLRMAPPAADPGAARQKVVTTLCAKLPQMPPSIVNVLVLVAGDPAYSAAVVGDAARLLGDRAAHKDEPFLARYGFTGAPDFHRQYARLSAVGVRRARPHGRYDPAGLWINPQARHPLPPAIATLLQR